MASYLDPFRELLDVRAEGAPSHYELLGLADFERDASAISMGYARSRKLMRLEKQGDHAAAAEHVLEQLNVAFNCLRDPKSKAKYDKKLRREPKRQKPDRKRVVQSPQPPDTDATGLPVQSTVSASIAYRQKTRGNPEQWVIIAAGAILLLVGMVFLIAQSTRQRVAVRGPNDRAATKEIKPVAPRRPRAASEAPGESTDEPSRADPSGEAPASEDTPSREPAASREPNSTPTSPETNKPLVSPRPLPTVVPPEVSGNRTEPGKGIEPAVRPLNPSEPEIRRFDGDTAGVQAVAFLSDKGLLTVGRDKTIRLWNTETGRETRAITGHADVVHCAAVSSDGKFILTGSSDGTVRAWDSTGKPLDVLKGHSGAVGGVAISPSSAQAASASHDKTVRLWDLKSGQEVRHLDGPAGWTCVAFTPDGRYVLCGGWNGTLSIWEAGNGKELHRLDAHQDVIHSIAGFADGERAITASWDGTVRIWNIRAGRQVDSLKTDSPVLTLALSKDGRRVATSHEDGAILLWGSETGEPLGRFLEHTSRVSALAFSSNGTRLVSAALDDTVRLWDLRIPVGFRAAQELRAPSQRKPLE